MVGQEVTRRIRLFWHDGDITSEQDELAFYDTMSLLAQEVTRAVLVPLFPGELAAGLRFSFGYDGLRVTVSRPGAYRSLSLQVLRLERIEAGSIKGSGVLLFAAGAIVGGLLDESFKNSRAGQALTDLGTETIDAAVDQVGLMVRELLRPRGLDGHGEREGHDLMVWMRRRNADDDDDDDGKAAS